MPIVFIFHLHIHLFFYFSLCNQASFDVLLHYSWTQWNPSQLVNSPVFFFRCPLCSRWIGNCISALLVLRECKVAVLYHLKLINIQLVCAYLHAPICVYIVGNSDASFKLIYASWEIKKHKSMAFLPLYIQHSEHLSLVSALPSFLLNSEYMQLYSEHFFKHIMWRKRGWLL